MLAENVYFCKYLLTFFLIQTLKSYWLWLVLHSTPVLIIILVLA